MITMGFRLNGRACTVVGGGKVSERRIRLLLDEGAQITVISPHVTDAIAQWALEGRLMLYKKPYSRELLGSPQFVVIATDNKAVNEAAAADGRRKGAFINRADVQSDCDFTFPASLVMGDLVISIMTGSASPRLNRLLKQDMMARYKPVETVLPELVQLRRQVKELLPTPGEREVFWQKQLDTEAMELILSGQWKRVEEQIKDAISSIGLKS
ncbi:MAG: bifunctional precorrin-2 dehydrogenase/sirohydrochlorin ferrochelatase [Veillonella sp.]|uniref:precorrin-2 dehydrogenase/sirohydrochlorin ferrochelatase family protein n=1 Tax=Veillonella sp. TaxID=1926307 RepID=UPI0025FEFCAD|nr:bifunctional precorrin-2 dehydrogenase/sirohydrochlorin ferrochelatase [Veillonella sp.]MBS4914282.1 bifunctional precorrin-2 dehydrogenase/sirohydrochlorin ferrochelatase [Veillonella sp.]